MSAVAETTFDLVGDGDDVQLFEDTEQLFVIQISCEENGRIETFGQLFELVETKSPTSQTQICLLSEAYRKLLRYGGKTCKNFPPATRLDDLRGGATVRSFVKDLSAQSGYDLDDSCTAAPILGLAWSLWVALGAGLVAVSGLSLGLGWVAILVGAAAAGAMAAFPPRLEFAPHVQTVGDMVRATLHRNLARIGAESLQGNRADRRRMLEGVCRDASGYRGPIDDCTTFFRSTARKGP